MAKLQEVYNCFMKWLDLDEKDLYRIDVALAVCMLRGIPGTKVWIIFIASSGDWKSILLNSLDHPERTYRLLRLTTKTLTSGNPKKLDLAPQLHDKIMLIADMAQISTMNEGFKSELMSQLRDLYDGFAGLDSGGDKQNAKYQGLNISLLAGSTPIYDEQISITQSLGTRELLFRAHRKPEEYKHLFGKLDFNEQQEEKMELELQTVVNSFLDSVRYKDCPLNENLINELRQKAQFLSLMRSTADIDKFSGEVNNIYTERPTRCYKQLIRLSKALKSLDPEYDDSKVLSVIQHIVTGSCHPLRLEILYYLQSIPNEWFSTPSLQDVFKRGYKTVYAQLNILFALGYIQKKSSMLYPNSQNPKVAYEWSFTKKEIPIEEKMEEVIVQDGRMV